MFWIATQQHLIKTCIIKSVIRMSFTQCLEAEHRNLVMVHQYHNIPSYGLWNSLAIRQESKQQRLEWWNTIKTTPTCVQNIIDSWKQILKHDTCSKLSQLVQHVPKPTCVTCQKMFGPTYLDDYNSDSDSDYIPEQDSEEDYEKDSEYSDHSEMDLEESQNSQKEQSILDEVQEDHDMVLDTEEEVAEDVEDVEEEEEEEDEEEDEVESAEEIEQEKEATDVKHATMQDAMCHARLHQQNFFLYTPKRGVRRGQLCKYTKQNGTFKFDCVIPCV